MRKLRIIYALFALLAVSCGRDELVENEVRRPVVPGKQSSVIIEGEDGDGQGVTTRAGSRVEFTGGYATGAGLYDGEDDATVAAVPYSGYQLVSFTGGPVGGSSSQFSGKNQYSFNIQLRDWKFTVSFKKEYTVTVSAGTGGTVSGGGKVLDGSSCTVTARANSGYSFDGWYEGSSKVSSSASYTFTVSSNRTLTARFTATVPSSPILTVSIVDENLDERGGSLGELDYGEVEERTSGAYLIRTYKIYEDEYGYLPERIYATSTGNGEFIGWYQNGKLFSSSPVLIDQDIDYLRGAHICAAFSGQANPDGAPSQVTIKLYSSAGGASGGKGKVGFSAGSLSYSTQTKTVKYGEEITIYAEGDEIVGDYSVTHYYCTGFYLDSGAAIKTFSDTNRLHSYTFTATRNMDISADWRKYDY